MTSREELIEEAAKAMYRRANTLSMPEATYLSEAALAVFEKAHTPTDDEREALAEIIHRVIEGAYTFEGDLDPSVDETLVRELTAAGFRRPTFPERGEAQEVAMDQATILRETVAQVWPGSVVAAAALAGAEALESAYGKGN